VRSASACIQPIAERTVFYVNMSGHTVRAQNTDLIVVSYTAPVIRARAITTFDTDVLELLTTEVDTQAVGASRYTLYFKVKAAGVTAIHVQQGDRELLDQRVEATLRPVHRGVGC
jgi:hypothetical protein